MERTALHTIPQMVSGAKAAANSAHLHGNSDPQNCYEDTDQQRGRKTKVIPAQVGVVRLELLARRQAANSQSTLDSQLFKSCAIRSGSRSKACRVGLSKANRSTHNSTLHQAGQQCTEDLQPRHLGATFCKVQCVRQTFRDFPISGL